MKPLKFEIKFATIDDAPLILTFIKELAEYEKLAHEVVATCVFRKHADVQWKLLIDNSYGPAILQEK